MGAAGRATPNALFLRRRLRILCAVCIMVLFTFYTHFFSVYARTHTYANETGHSCPFPQILFFLCVQLEPGLGSIKTMLVWAHSHTATQADIHTHRHPRLMCFFVCCVDSVSRKLQMAYFDLHFISAQWTDLHRTTSKSIQKCIFFIQLRWF